MTTKHTPGPWHAEDFSHMASRSTLPKIWSKDGPVAVICDRLGAVAAASIDADARLIAAAPETAAERDRLREALEAIRSRIQGEWDNPSLAKFGPLATPMVDDLLAMANAALANTTPPAPDPLREAAPELLEALRNLCYAFTRPEFQGGTQKAFDTELRAASAAIAKAEGRP